jgi:hypothetical protein
VPVPPTALRSALITALRREYRVAFSKGGQSRGVRVVRWAVFFAVATAFCGTRYFWLWTAGLPLLGVAVHAFYRWKTHGWTRAWGGWSELDFDDHSAPR